MKHLRSFFIITLAVFYSISIFCTVPQDPSSNPSNASITLQTTDGFEVIPFGTEKEISIEIMYTSHFESIDVYSGCGNYTSTFQPNQKVVSQIITISPVFATAGPCTLYATGTMVDKSYNAKQALLPLFILADQKTVTPDDQKTTPSFVDAPSKITGGKPDTLVFAVDNTAQSDSLSIALVTRTPLDTSVFRVIPSGSDSIVIAVSGAATSGSADIGIITSNNTDTDTNWYPVTIDNPTDTPVVPDTKLTAVIPTGPENGAAGVTLTPSFSWTGGIASQGDSVFFQVHYGTSATALSQTTAVVTSRTVTLGTTSQLAPKTVHYWQIVGWSKTTPDTVRSVVVSFTTLDPTAADLTGPQIAQTSGPAGGDRVTEATGSITVSVSDPSGIKSVTAKLNAEAAVTLTPGTDNTFSYNYTLGTYGTNTLIFTAADRSANGNSSEKVITVNYNTIPAAITLTAPAANGTGVSTSPAFEWSGGQDADGDIVTFTVMYRTSQTALGSAAAVSGSNTATVGNPLEYNKTYYWQVTAKSTSTACPDEVKSAVGSFTTEGSLPTITAQPKSQKVNEAESATFSVTAAGFGNLSYQWRMNGTEITGATAATYEIPSATTAMDGNKFDCVVKNEVGMVTSDAAQLTVQPAFTLTYDKNGGSGTPPAAKKYASGAIVAIAPTTGITMNGWTCIGWGDGEKLYNATSGNTTISMGDKDITLWAVWQATVTFNYNGSGTADVKHDVIKGQSISNFPANPSRDGFKFIEWNTLQNGGGQPFTASSTISGTMTVYAKWEATTCTITLNPNGGSVQPTQKQVAKGAWQSVLPTPSHTDDCLTFDGWYTSASGGTFVQTLNNDQTVYAHWKAKTATVTYHFDPGSAMGSGDNVKSSETFNCGATVTLQPFIGSGSITRHDLGWYEVTFPNLGKVTLFYIMDESGSNLPSLSLPIQGNRTITVQYYMSSTL